jgi:hypothetical protein
MELNDMKVRSGLPDFFHDLGAFLIEQFEIASAG